MALCSTIATTPLLKKLSCDRRSLRLPHHSCRLRGRNAENLFVVRANSNETWTKLNVTDKISKAEPPYVPVYIGLPLGIIDTDGDLIDPYVLKNQLRILKSIDVDGVMVNCWWGIVEGHAPKQYNWTGYKKLFQFVREHCLKLQVVMSFHGCGENIGDDVHIPLPRWVMELGSNNPEIFFTDSEGRRNHECLTWGVDNERVLLGRTPVRVYFDFMQSFREEFDEFFVDGVISEIEIGLGPSGELRYPSHPTKHGWKYPGIGEFQCHDKYLMTSLKNAAKVRGVPEWGRGPDNVGSYNSKPQETKFFCDRESDFFGYRNDYDSFYGRFFLKWYSQVLIDHGDLVLAWANIAFGDTPLTVKLPIIHWWYNTNSQAAELTTGFYNSAFKEGYAPITSMLKTHAAAVKFPCVDLQTSKQYKNFPNALGTPKEVLWQVVNAALESDIPIASENGLTCYDREGYNKLLEKAIPFDNPDRIPLRDFTYQRLGTELLTKKINFMEFERFVKRMHGELEYEYF